MANNELDPPYMGIKSIIIGENEYHSRNKEGIMPNRIRWAIGCIALLVILSSAPYIVDSVDKFLGR